MTTLSWPPAKIVSEKKRLVVDAHAGQQRVREQEARGRGRIDEGELLAAQLLDAVDARVGPHDDLRAVGLAALAQRGEDDLGAVLVVRQHVGERRQPAHVDLVGAHRLDDRGVRRRHRDLEVQIGGRCEQLGQRLTRGEHLLRVGRGHERHVDRVAGRALLVARRHWRRGRLGDSGRGRAGRCGWPLATAAGDAAGECGR